MTHICKRLLEDENGFIVSSELALIATILVLAMVVGLSELAHSINQELEDVASAFGSVNQSYRYAGQEGHHGQWSGSKYSDRSDQCDRDCDIVATQPKNEGRGSYKNY
jgi:Flp pilus assembly pilin Flp